MGIVGIAMEGRIELQTFVLTTGWDARISAKIQKNALHMLSTETTQMKKIVTFTEMGHTYLEMEEVQ